MSYGKDLRKRVLDFVKAGGGKAQASRLFKVHVSTIFIWLKQPAGHEAAKSRNTSSRTHDRQELARYIKSNPDKHLTEIAKHFNVSVGSISHSLKKLGITRKKRLSDIQKVKSINTQDADTSKSGTKPKYKAKQ